MIGDKYTFATIKVGKGQGRFALLAKKRSQFFCYEEPQKYYFVGPKCDDGVLLFRTKAEAHSVANRIDKYGLEEAGYKLGEEYSYES